MMAIRYENPNRNSECLMKKGKTAEERSGIRRETLLLVVFVSLLVGFLGGVVFSAYKLGPKTAVPGAMPPPGHADSGRIAMLEASVQKNPRDAASWIELGDIYYDSKQIGKAIDAYESALKARPDDADVWTDLGVMYRRDGKPRKALEAFKKAQSLDPKHEASLFNAGVVLLHDLHQPGEAKAMWEKLVRLNPDARAPDGQLVKDLVKAIP
jgi:cytochrome c-type biogenesis protein CcmH/NrfG